MTTEAVPAPGAVGSPTRKLGATSRTDRWWIQPLLIIIALSTFGIYSIVVVIINKHFVDTADGAHLLSPFASPNLNEIFSWNLPIVSVWVLWAPLGLRLTCYYYRKSVYRAFFLSPPACTVAGLQRKKYAGETKLPFVLMNFHRFFFYAATVVIGFLGYDVVRSLFYKTATGTHFGISLGSGIMLLNVVMLSSFTFGCNSFRHLIGGKMNCFDCGTVAKTRHGLWKKVTTLNGNHQLFAWVSMYTVGLTDLYIRLASAGVFTDPHHIF
jgi:hypothetical protein